MCQKSEIAPQKRERKKAEAESKKPHQMCAVTVTKAYQIEGGVGGGKEDILQENLLWYQNSCEIEVNIFLLKKQ